MWGMPKLHFSLRFASLLCNALCLHLALQAYWLCAPHMVPFEAKYLPLGAKFWGKGEFCLGCFFPRRKNVATGKVEGKQKCVGHWVE